MFFRGEIILNKKMNKTVFIKEKKETPAAMPRSKNIDSLVEFLEKLNKSEGLILIVIENSNVECETAVSKRSVLL